MSISKEVDGVTYYLQRESPREAGISYDENDPLYIWESIEPHLKDNVSEEELARFIAEGRELP